MKFICTQENLRYGLFIVSHISSKNINLPILNNIFIQADQSSIKFLSTNLEMGISCTIRGKVEKDGAYTVQARLFSDYINLLLKDKVEITLIEDEQKNTSYLHIQCKNQETKLKGMPAADFPLIPQVMKNNPITCSVADLRQAISQVIFAASNSESRPEISGILMNFQTNALTLAATDSFRLAEKTINATSASEHRVIIPPKTLYEVQRILNSFKEGADIESVDMVEMYIIENQILFKLGNIEITSRLIEGQYPDYKQIIPTNFQTTFEVPVGEMVKVTKAASLFARAGIFDVKLEVLPDNGEVVVSSNNSQVGENISRLVCTAQGKKNDIVLNYRYMLDGLQNLESEEAIFSLIDNSNPCILKSKEKDAYLYIIMPIKQ